MPELIGIGSVKYYMLYVIGTFEFRGAKIGEIRDMFHAMVGADFGIRFRHQEPDGPIVRLFGMELINYVLLQLHRGGYIDYTELGDRLFAVDAKYHGDLDKLMQAEYFEVDPWTTFRDEEPEDLFFRDESSNAMNEENKHREDTQFVKRYFENR